MSDSELSSPGSSPEPPVRAPTSPERPSSNRYDTMFGSDHDSEAGHIDEPDLNDNNNDDENENYIENDNGSDDDDDEAMGARKRSRRDIADDKDEPLEDLFGDESGGEGGGGGGGGDKRRGFDDDELEGLPRNDEGSPGPIEPERFVEITLPRHPGPRVGIDGHIYLLKVPHTLSMEPVIFDPEKFTMPTTDPDSDVSAYTHATNSIRVRKDPRNPSKLQSNARIIRWSDGTLSLQIASSSQIYDLAPKPLTSDPKRPDKYQPTEDSHTYLLDPHESAGTLRVIGHATQALTVVPAGGNLANNRAVQRLHSELAIAINSSGRKNPLEMTDLKDPEAERKEAERIAKEKERANKKLEAQRRRAKERDPLEGAARRSYQRVTGTRSKRDSPPITAGRGRGREDEYDLEDEFIEGSDDEIDEEASDGANEDDEMDEKRPKRETERDRKRRRVVDESDEE